ncbi:hypothetical protein ACFOZ5_01930 [Marinobacter lacisalsi]|uniref:SH3b domain-containing protein n=1 Tax=Marinobacter lacisalsi TaxID=475979 RepID=A0ABV8QE58_9GAMM
MKMNQVQPLFIQVLAFLAMAVGMAPMQAATAGQQSQLEVSVPEESELTYDRKEANPDFIDFSGEVEQTGVLLAYWELLYMETGPLEDSEPLRNLKFRFYPGPDSRQALPSIAYTSRNEQSPLDRIFIYHTRSQDSMLDEFFSEFDQSDPEARQLLDAFQDLPPGFLENQEGKAVQPVTITLSGLASFVEGGHLFTFGQVTSVKSLSLEDYALALIQDAQSGDYLARPWDYRLQAPDATALYQQPGGARLTDIPAGTHTITRLEPVQSGWVKVRYQDEQSGKELTGYMDAREVQPVN